MLNKKIILLLKLIESFLTLALFVLLLIVISPVLPFKNIPRTYTVVSASMEPAIKTGSVAITKPIDPKLLKVGDIVAFTSPYNPKDTILHRIESIKSTDPLRFSTKGDNNNDPDQWDLPEAGIKGRYLFSIPFLGIVSAFIRKPLGFSLLIGLPALFFVISQLFNIKKIISEEIEKGVAAKLKEKSTLNKIILFALFANTLIALNFTKVIFALYQDSVSISNFSLSVESLDLELSSSITTFPEFPLINLCYFDIGASANPGAASIKLYYSFNFGPWEEYPETITGDNGTFHFQTPNGDGLYDFTTLAFDQNNQAEDKIFSYFTNQLKIDTQPPTTNINSKSLSTPSYSGQNYLSGGDFEKGMADWKIDSSIGDHHIFEDENQNHLFILGSNSKSINGTDALYQNFSLPASASATLNFSYRLFSQDTSEYDHFNVDLFDASGNQLIETVLSVGNLSTDFTSDTGWRSVSRSLAHLVNQNLRLRFSLTDTGLGDDFNSWLFLDDVKVSTLDTRVGETSTVDFLASDLSSQVAETTPPTNLIIGENDLTFTTTDSAYNSDNNHHQNITVLPPLVLNKLFFHTSDNQIEIYNNSSEAILLSKYQIIETRNNSTKNFNTSSPIYLNPHSGYTFSFPLYSRGPDTVQLKIGDSIIDSITYQPKSDGAYYDGEYWFRSPSGLGPWTSSVSPLSALLTRLSSNKLTLSVSYIPQNFGSNPTDFLEYEILYSDSAGPQQIIGRISPQSVDQNLSQRDFYLGTCSSGSCLPSSGLGSSFTLKINGRINNQLISPSTRTFNLPL